MFTGLVEEEGKITKIVKDQNGLKITIECSKIIDDLKVDDSVAVNGVCQTAVDVEKSSFTVQAIRDTIERTTFKYLKNGEKVNLERAMKLSSRFGGHIVQGHVDCVGKITDIKYNSLSTTYSIIPKREYIKYFVAHGSVTLDGVSLTVQELFESYFTVSIIPHSLANTGISRWKIGTEINIECDILGKYVDRLLNLKESSISINRLKELGY
ncbi:MAG: riboflavin synthase [Candidatus Cloacimonadota bacterium]|nr:MAG: riboflavin synthase [Candidatus Cloacimonadota bacterium]PIE77481.1 MAG: riboflavin synthase [Candidatus Delongbacteria bacterium]